MAVTTIMDTDLQSRQHEKLSAMAVQEKNTNGEVKMSQAEKEKLEEANKTQPLRANVAAQRDASVDKSDDPYGYRNRKKTVSRLRTRCRYLAGAWCPARIDELTLRYRFSNNIACSLIEIMTV